MPAATARRDEQLDRFGNILEERLGGRWGVLAAFGALHLLMVLLGYGLKQDIRDPAVMWSAAGLLFVTLWLSRPSRWPAVLAVQFVVELGVVAVLREAPPDARSALYPLANGVEAVVAALLARWLVGDMTYLRTRQILQLTLVTAAGSLVAALLVALVNTLLLARAGEPPAYLNQLQISWVGDWLGAVTIAPMLYCWISPLRRKHHELALRNPLELAVLFALVAGVCVYVFGAPKGSAASLLQLPTAIIGVLLYASVRLPPRWMATLCAFAVLLCCWLAASQQGPFAAGSSFVRTVEVQTFLGTLAVVTLLMSVSMTEKNVALGELAESEYRYRGFVELSMEAVWRVELAQPMPLALPLERQQAWLRQHARVVETSRSYQALDPAMGPGGMAFWRSELPWCAAYESQLAEAAKSGNYSADGLRFRMENHGRIHSYLTSFCGVVEQGHLQRIWGVARDITELSDLNSRLLREQERLKNYARQIVTAEEKARRATAVDLHDGIGQSLVGMAMTLEVASRDADSDQKLMIDEVRGRLREVQERTRHMISDLSPPGLYELGLVPALQWLTVYVRGHDRLHVELDATAREEVVRVEMRVLVFKLVRELLRNVVKHAGVSAARVQVRGDLERLHVEVSDQGRGFEWQMDMFGGASGGFGLWSIADRVHEVGGSFRVDTRPGGGSRFQMEFPLRQPSSLVQPARPWNRSDERSA